MPKKAEPETLHHDFAFASDRDLDDEIAEFRREHEEAQQQRLAMHARRSLGPGKVRVTFRVVDPPRKRR